MWPCAVGSLQQPANASICQEIRRHFEKDVIWPTQQADKNAKVKVTK